MENGEFDPTEAARTEIAGLEERFLRMAADFDNYRKRSRREVEDARARGFEELLGSLLPVFDNLERAVKHAEQTGAGAIVEGLKMVLGQLADVLGRMGIERVDSVGRPFDPSVHEAVGEVDTDEHQPGTVVTETQAGYTHGDRLVRAAMVVVARGDG